MVALNEKPNCISPLLSCDYHPIHRPETSGNVADYIPQLATVNPDLFALSFCDIHGNRFNLGDSTTSFSLQSTSKPLSYCLARELEMQNGGTPVHEHVGYEPSGRAFNEFVLNRENLPHNPLINAGAIMVS